jgi:hypothetical protein
MKMGNEWENVPENIEEWFGFVYLITRLNALLNEPKYYIGCKQFFSKTKRPPLKGNKRKRTIFKESDWKDYYGSSEELKKDVAKHGKENYKREILVCTTCKWESKYLEAREQINRHVLIRDDYYNGILNLRIGKVPKALKAKYEDAK